MNIKKIKEYFPDASSNNFEFTEVSQDKGKKEVSHLNAKNHQLVAVFQNRL